jgi:hypothetical protein
MAKVCFHLHSSTISKHLPVSLIAGPRLKSLQRGLAHSLSLAINPFHRSPRPPRLSSLLESGFAQRFSAATHSKTPQSFLSL